MHYARLIKRWTSVAVLTLLSTGVLRADDDPGAPDSLRLDPAAVLVGQAGRVAVSVFNDYPVYDLTWVLNLTSQDSGWVAFDSAVFVGRLGDPAVLPNRMVSLNRLDGASPDTLVIALLRDAGWPLPPGGDTVAWLYFTGGAPGQVTLDSTDLHEGLVNLDFISPEGDEYTPRFRPATIDVFASEPPLEFSQPADKPRMTTTGRMVAFEVAAYSPMRRDVRCGLLGFRKFDNDSVLPANQPDFDTLNPGRFNWLPDVTEPGIWRADFAAYDAAGHRAIQSVLIEVATSRDYLVPMTVYEMPDVSYATGFAHGDLDRDGFPELILSDADAAPPRLSVYRYASSGRFFEVFSNNTAGKSSSISLGYFDANPGLDLLTTGGDTWQVWRGRGNGSFATTASSSLPGPVTSATLVDYDGDAFLDYACVTDDDVTVLRGASGGHFTEAFTINAGDAVIALQGADFNADGRDDLAIATRHSLQMYLNNRPHGFANLVAYHVTDVVDNAEIVSVDGADFNDDGRFDLCVVAQSQYQDRSQVIVCASHADGTLETRPVRDLAGAVTAVKSGDFNGDTKSDVAFLNATYGYLGILWGDGAGGFLNETRYPLPQGRPLHFDCLDVDRDGDLDAVVAAEDVSGDNERALFLFENGLDPAGLAPVSLTVRAHDNVRLTVVSPDGGRLNDLTRCTPGASFCRCRLDDDAVGDEVADLNVVQPGRYRLTVAPKPDQPTGSAFSLEYSVDGVWYRLARELAMPGDGLDFSIYPDGESAIYPAPGEFVTNALPTFSWPSVGTDRFELASDFGFTHIIEAVSVVGGVYTLSLVLPHNDSTMYYWRVRPESESDWGETFVFNAVRAPGDPSEQESDPSLPETNWLSQNYPNPFNPVTTVEYHLGHATHVTVSIHNVLGQLIRVLVDETLPEGTHTVDWDAHDTQGRDVASGIYFYRLTADGQSLTRKMVLVR